MFKPPPSPAVWLVQRRKDLGCPETVGIVAERDCPSPDLRSPEQKRRLLLAAVAAPVVVRVCRSQLTQYHVGPSGIRGFRT